MSAFKTYRSDDTLEWLALITPNNTHTDLCMDLQIHTHFFMLTLRQCLKGLDNINQNKLLV